MAWKYIEYRYPVEFLFEKMILWTDSTFRGYFALKEKFANSSWNYYSGNASHGLEAGSLLVARASESEAQTNYWRPTPDTNNRVLAILPDAVLAKYIRVYINDTDDAPTIVHEFRPSTVLSADEIVTGDLTITDQFGSPPKITVTSSSTDRVVIGKIGSAYGIIGYDSNASPIFELTDANQNIGGWDFTSSQFSKNNALLSSGGKIKLGSGNDVVEMDSQDATYRLWIGHDTAASAPFRVTKGGSLTADSGTFTGTLSASSITTRELADSSVSSGIINTEAVIAGKIAINAVEASTINTNAVTTIKIDTEAVTAGKIAANAVEASTIKADAVNADKISANAVEATAIKANAVTTNKIKADAVTSDKISVTNLEAVSANTGHLEVTATIGVGAGIEIDGLNNRIRTESGGNYADMSASGFIGYDSVLGRTFYLPTDGTAPYFSSGEIKEVTYKVWNSGVLKIGSWSAEASVAPATTGGLVIGPTSMTGYNASGDTRFKVVYSGTDQGDVEIGDISVNSGVKWDQSEGSLKLRSDSASAIVIESGGDIKLIGDNENPGKVIWVGSDLNVDMYITREVTANFHVIPRTTAVSNIHIGNASYLWSWVHLNAYHHGRMKSERSTNQYCHIDTYTNSSADKGGNHFRIEQKDGTGSNQGMSAIHGFTAHSLNSGSYYSWYPPNLGGQKDTMGVLLIVSNRPEIYGTVYYSTDDSASVLCRGTVGASINLTTGTLTGINGVASRVNISAGGTNKIYMNNRLGHNVGFYIMPIVRDAV